MDVSPLAALTHAFGGNLPEFASRAEAQELIEGLVQGLWNRLSEHQDSRKPFRLSRFEVTATRSALLHLAQVRVAELKAFADGLFGDAPELALPPKAHEAVDALAELLGLFEGAAKLLADESKPAPAAELKPLLRNLQRMSIVADERIHQTVLACKRARGQELQQTMQRAGHPFSQTPRTARGEPAVPSGGEELEPELFESPLSRRITRQGVTVDVEIYGTSPDAWILEIVDVENASHVWDEPFKTDREALEAALQALDESPLEFFGRPSDQPLN